MVGKYYKNQIVNPSKTEESMGEAELSRFRLSGLAEFGVFRKHNGVDFFPPDSVWFAQF